MGTPTTTFEAWLVQYLKDDATLSGLVDGRVYTNVPPVDRALPCVLIALSTGSESVAALSGAVAIERLRYEVVALTNTDDLTDIVEISDRLEVLLGATIADETEFKAHIIRAGSIERQNSLYGVTRYTRLGAEWRVLLQPKG
jgi:hypothetical protein